MIQKIWAIVVTMGLISIIGAWIGAAIVKATGQADGFTVGCASREAWLVNALIYSDGQAFFRCFTPNPTHHTGLFSARASGLRPWQHGRLIDSNGYSSTVRLHLLWPIILFAALAFHALGVPVLRRRWRRRTGRCAACGYDLHSNPSAACPECGVVTATPPKQIGP